MKATIIGGGGRVGSNAAFALQCAGIIKEIQILDYNQDLADGEALDLLHGASCLGGQRITSGGYEEAADSDFFVITAGSRRKRADDSSPSSPGTSATASAARASACAMSI